MPNVFILHVTVHEIAQVLNPTRNVIAKVTKRRNLHSQPLACKATPFPAALFSPTAGAVAPAPVAVAVQLCPHTYPLGQQPPPSFAAQVSHPWAQLPVPRSGPADPISGPVGATITMPFVFATVVEAEAGQDVKSQSRPTRQQPP